MDSRRRLAILVGVFVLLCLGVGTGVHIHGNRLRILGNSVVTLQAPNRLKRLDQLHPDARIQVGDVVRDQYMYALSDAKADFPNKTLHGYGTDVVADFRQVFDNPRVSATEPVSVDERDATLYVVEGTGNFRGDDGKARKVSATALIMVVDGRDHFHQLVAWTHSADFERTRPMFEEVMFSLREE